MRHYSYLFYRIVLRQWYGGRRAVQMESLRILLGLRGMVKIGMGGCGEGGGLVIRACMASFS